MRRRRWIDLQNKTGCVKNRSHFFVHGSYIISTSSSGMSCKLLLLVWSVGDRTAPFYSIFKAVHQAIVCASQVYIREKYISTRPQRLFDVAFPVHTTLSDRLSAGCPFIHNVIGSTASLRISLVIIVCSSNCIVIGSFASLAVIHFRHSFVCSEYPIYIVSYLHFWIRSIVVYSS